MHTGKCILQLSVCGSSLFEINFSLIVTAITSSRYIATIRECCKQKKTMKNELELFKITNFGGRIIEIEQKKWTLYCSKLGNTTVTNTDEIFQNAVWIPRKYKKFTHPGGSIQNTESPDVGQPT